jgi:hypothetical protein
MKRTYLIHAAIAASAAVAVVLGKWATTEAQAQAAQAQTRSLPTFEVDKSWPKLPPQYKLGDVSAMASDAQGNMVARAALLVSAGDIGAMRRP